MRARRRTGTQAVLRLLRHHRTGLYSLALLVGLVAGLGAIAFRLGIDAWTRLMTGTSEYAGGASTGLLAALGPWFVLAAPVLSGALVGPLMALAGRTTTGHGVSGVIWAARRSDGAMAPVPAAASTASACLTIGGGGSVGPEGPIAELGASAATLFGRRLGLPTRSVRLLAAAGTAAGIAAAFNAPLAGAFFAMEVILLDFTLDAFAFVVLASVSATVLSHHVLGEALATSLPVLDLAGDARLGWVAVLGLVGGAVGVGFSRCRYLMADAARSLLDHLRVPVWARPALGGLAVGAMLLAFPQTYGEGEAVLDHVLDGGYGAGVLLVLVLVKVLATCLTLAVGFTGGVFAPSLFIGAALGAAFGTALVPGQPSAAAVFGVISMGAVFTGSARAPITAVVLIIEMTGQYSLLLPLMLASVLATFMSRFLTRTTIYTEELRRRGDDVEDPLVSTLMGRALAREVMTSPPGLLEADATLAEAARELRDSGSSVLPVVGPDHGRPGAFGYLLGCVSALQVAEASLAAGAADRPVGDLDLARERVPASDSATAALGRLTRAHADGLPVVEATAQGDALVGWVSQQDMVRRLYRHQRDAYEAAQARTSFGARVQAWWRRGVTRRGGGPDAGARPVSR
ncbi:chloride channel protein [Actinomyces sp. 186855]|nr:MULTISPECIES: chloride channel protein [unclassified Actinomyces]MCL3778369.1 chloride channel protein [Actinomyces sp. AC-20-1]MCL3789957.1 chloride channel protein [Actinomyces sp. 187325]MCL3792164.1 chloride channel protein [Actinomyces sp. 186855]MCL3794341.1 chloride channel protein [Actinomyces sp. 217892]